MTPLTCDTRRWASPVQGTFTLLAGHPPIELPEPGQIKGRAKDLPLAHYLPGHDIGGN